MLRRFSYLDTVALEQYISALENGLVSEETRRTMHAGSAGGSLDVKIAKGEGARSHESETAQTFSDTAPAQFDRLLKAAELQPEALGWIEVIQPEVDLQDVGRGAMVAWECDLSTPEVIQMLSQAGDAAGALSAMAQMLPSAEKLGLDVAGLPDQASLEAMTTLVGGMNIQRVIVGDSPDTTWKIFARIQEQFVQSELEGPMQIIGKVTRVIPSGSNHPLVNMPGSQLGNREERRARAKQQPQGAQKSHFIDGPAIELSLLAAYI